MIARRALTTKAVETLKSDPDRRLEVPDPALAGLYLVVQPSGAKSWAVRYRHAGKPRKLTLGRWPIMTIAAARAAATEALERIDHGADPAGEKAAAKRAAPTRRDTFAALLDLYDRRHLSRLRSGAQVRRALEIHALPAWGETEIAEISRRDVRDLLDEIVEAGHATTANRVRLYLSGFFNFLVERDVIEVSPVMGIRPPARETARERVLSDEEVRWLWQACGRVGQPWGPAVQLLLLTGQRAGEVFGMTDDELDGDLWRLPAARVKNGRAHEVPLSAQAREVLAGVERIGDYIFTTTGRTPVSGRHKARERLHRFMLEAAEAERGESVEIPHWTFHDLRRTAATGLARLGIPVRVTEAVLNHVSGTGGGIVAVYQRHDFAAEKRQALEAWGRFVTDLVDGGGAANVVRIGANA